MRDTTTRHLVLAFCATALVSVVTVPAADASGHHRKHHHHRVYMGVNGVRSPGLIAPVRSHGNVCPGIARSFDCAVWPPPMDEDPDRKISGSDGAG